MFPQSFSTSRFFFSKAILFFFLLHCPFLILELHASPCAFDMALFFLKNSTSSKYPSRRSLSYDIDEYLRSGPVLEYQEYHPSRSWPFMAEHLRLGKSGGKNLEEMLAPNGEIIFIKWISDRENRNQRQVRMAKIIDDLGIGPKFFGRISFQGNTGLAFEKLYGWPIYHPKDIYRYYRFVNQKTIDDLRHIIKVFLDNQISSIDFQYFLQEDGHVKVIDVEVYTTLTLSNEGAIEQYLLALKNNPEIQNAGIEELLEIFPYNYLGTDEAAAAYQEVSKLIAFKNKK